MDGDQAWTLFCLNRAYLIKAGYGENRSLKNFMKRSVTVNNRMSARANPAGYTQQAAYRSDLRQLSGAQEAFSYAQPTKKNPL